MSTDLSIRVADFSDRHELLPATAPVLALVSGGPDSMCLLGLLRELHDGPLGVVVFDHGLRDESRGEAERVAAVVERLGIQVWVRGLGLAPGGGLQERARNARRAAASSLAGEHGFLRIATGHTASDQAETVLFRIARGTGRTGALGIAPIDGQWIRPLLCLTRDETRAWCTSQGVDVVDDPTNADVRYARNRVRHDVLAAWETIHPGATRAVGRFADLLRDEATVLAAVVDEAWVRCGCPEGLYVAQLALEPEAVRRLLVRRLLSESGVSPDTVWVERATALVTAGRGRTDAPGGALVVRRGVLMVGPVHRVGPALEPVALDVPGEVVFGGLRLAAGAAIAEPPRPDRVAVDVAGPLEVRSTRPGDRLTMGGGGRQAVGRLLAVSGVPVERRGEVPVVVAGERVVWIAGYRADPTLLARPGVPATVLEVSPA